MSISHKQRGSTPSSILKKTPTLKTRLNQLNQKPQKVRFVLPHSKRVQNIFKEFVDNSVSRDYEQLVCLIRDAELLDSDILSLLKEATECISLLNRDLRLFVEALLCINWIDRNAEVVKEYQSFIVNLLSAHNYHAKFVINKLVTLFLPEQIEPEWPDGVPTDSDCKKCVNVHALLNVLLKVVPMCKELLLQFITTNYPYYNKPTHVQEYYLHNLLWILAYQPSFRQDILHLVFSRLVVMDVNAPKEEIEKFKNEDEDIFQMEDETKSSKSIQTAFTMVNRHSVANSLDVCLNKIYDYFITECHDQITGELDWDKAKSLYHDMINVFDKVILPTYNTHHIQFSMFVLCAFKPSIMEAFLNYLWKKVCNPNVAPVLRQTAVTYMVSLIARASYVPLTMLKGTIQQFAEWIHAYISNQDGLECVNSDVRIHSVFYSVCQALFYVISFRHKDLVTSKKNITLLESLNLGKMVTCRLNPLRVCQSAVVQNFAAITRKYQLAYCYTVIEHNSRNMLPTIYQDEKGSVVVSNNILNDFYPFDPYVLERSGKKIIPIYREYQDSFEEIMEVEEKETSMTEVDDFLEDNNAYSVTPKGSRKFSYGSSPGFKFKG